jgi:hypothetical protein
VRVLDRYEGILNGKTRTRNVKCIFSFPVLAFEDIPASILIRDVKYRHGQYGPHPGFEISSVTESKGKFLTLSCYVM